MQVRFVRIHRKNALNVTRLGQNNGEVVMNYLFLGGTQFVGRAMVEVALSEGHSVSILHRGNTGGSLFPEAEHLLADRNGDLNLLVNRSWDVVVDSCGYTPKAVKNSCDALAGSAGKYVFVSTISVYRQSPGDGNDESAPLHDPAGYEVEEVTAETYGPLKVGCENVVAGEFGEKALIVRPGLIVGPHDPTDRFTFWLSCFDRRELTPVPTPQDAPCQVIDVRDLARWTIAASKTKSQGAFNLVGPLTTWLEWVQTFESLTSGRAQWVNREQVAKAGLEPWKDLPLWVGDLEAEHRAWRVSNDLAVAAGLTLTKFADTVATTLEWLRNERGAAPMKVGASDVALDRLLSESA